MNNQDNISGKTKRVFLKYENISRHLFCSICQDVFENPARLHCGHTFCYVCIQTWGRYTKQCPFCKQDLTKRAIEKDLIASLIIDDLPVKCSHTNCDWMGICGLVKKHQRSCKFKVKKKIVRQETKNLIQIPDQEDKKAIEID